MSVSDIMACRLLSTYDKYDKYIAGNPVNTGLAFGHQPRGNLGSTRIEWVYGIPR